MSEIWKTKKNILKILCIEKERSNKYVIYVVDIEKKGNTKILKENWIEYIFCLKKRDKVRNYCSEL